MKTEASPAMTAADLAALSDEDLLKLYRETNQSHAFEVLVRRHERELYRYLARYLGDPSLAEDVFQNTFLQLHQKRALYEPGRPVRPWLYSIATHQAVDELRKRKRQSAVSIDTSKDSSAHEPSNLIDLLMSDDLEPIAHLQSEERRMLVRESIEKLPELLRETLLLAYDQGLKYREIAEILDVPVGTVKSRLHSALGRLHDALKKAISA